MNQPSCRRRAIYAQKSQQTDNQKIEFDTQYYVEPVKPAEKVAETPIIKTRGRPKKR